MNDRGTVVVRERLAEPARVAASPGDVEPRVTVGGVPVLAIPAVVLDRGSSD
jgi:hypothetical protein